MSNDPPIARRDAIALRLAEGQAVVAAALAAEFAVSEDAIRRDLRALAAEGRCRRVYGGALPLSRATMPLAARREEEWEAKRLLARAAATTIRPGELVFLDSGSTSLALVEFLPEDADLVIATNAVEIAAAVLRRQDLRLVQIGGMVDPIIGGCVDAVALQAVLLMRIDRAFIGACAISGDGVGAFHYEDATLKRALISRSSRTLVMATTTKLGAQAPFQIAALSQIDMVVIEPGASPEQRAALDAGGCRALLVADPD